MGFGFHGGFGNTKGSSNLVTKENDYNIKFENTFSIEESQTMYNSSSSPNNNIASLSDIYPFSLKNGKFGVKGKNSQVIYSDDPINESIHFFNIISKGGVVSELSNGKGSRTDFGDGAIITHRLITSTKESPAVDINIKVKIENGISSQKIHFERRK